MIFTLIVSVLNAAGWIGFYFYLGGMSESPDVQLATILWFVICSAIGGLVSFHCTHVFDSVFLNTGHNLLTTSMASAPLVLMTYPPYLLGDYSIDFGDIVSCIIRYLLAYFCYFSCCIWPTYGLDEGKGWADLGWLFARFIIVSIAITFAAKVPSIWIGQYAWAAGAIISAPMSLVLAIKSKIID